MITFFSIVFVNNIVLLNFFGLENILNSTSKSDNAFRVIVSSILVMLSASFASFFIYNDILKPYKLEVITLLSLSITVIFSSVFVAYVLRKFVNILYTEIKDFIYISAQSSLIIGTLILNLDKEFSIYQYVYINICNALGFALIVVILTSIRGRLYSFALPKRLRGAPIVFFILGLLSMAFMGLS